MTRELSFKKDGTFKIMQLTDMHYTYDNQDDKKAVELANFLISKESPDFIMITGDLVYGDKNLEYVEKALRPVTESGLPWSFVFGNHDVEFNSSRLEFLSELQKFSGCMTFHDEKSLKGVGNHILEVKDKNKEIAWIIAGIDTGDTNKLVNVGGYGYVTHEQINWYREKIREYHIKNPLHSAMLFIHIPLPEFKDVWNYRCCYGFKGEEICCPKTNSGLFTAMLEEGHAKGLFAGHDHLNDFYGDYYGIKLGYGRYGGYSSYGSVDYLRGCRFMILNEDPQIEFETYISLENGTIIKEPYKHHPMTIDH